jgi:hypothetical protein
MKKEYIAPEMEIIEFDSEDVITESLLSSETELQPK